MMTEEILYARLKEALRDAIARHHLDERSISLKSRGLTPEEAIGRTARTDYPILNGREVMLQARFGEALGQAFTSAPVDFEGSLADVLELDTTHDPQAAGMLVATLNGVLRAVGEISNTVHCRDDGPELCAERYAALVRERFGTPRIALVGFQPALLSRLSKEFSVRVLDLNPEIVGTVRSGVLVEDGMAAYQDVVRGWAEHALQRFVRQLSGYRQAGAVFRYLLCRGGACPGGGTLLPHVGLRPVRRDWPWRPLVWLSEECRLSDIILTGEGIQTVGICGGKHMTDNDRILCQVLEQQLSLRLREGCRDVLLHLLPAPLRGLLYIALRSSAAGYARMWAGTRKMESRRQQPRKAGHLRQEEVLCGRPA